MPVTLMPKQKSILRQRRLFKPALWIVMATAALYIILHIEVPLLRQYTERNYFRTIPFLIFPHIVAGILALLCGPLQFSYRLRHRSPKFHRVLGRVYVISVLIAAPLAIVLAYNRRIPHMMPYFFLASSLQASTWIVTTVAAFLTARNRHIQQHRQWMVRSYAVTFTFIGIRVLVQFPFAVPHTGANFSLEIVFVTFMAILLSDIGLSWHELFHRRL
ncbi:DUF2306 domain-containing protein [Tunturiibacter gelidoferens]|jgi:uncharacterized membrane protein|uniref:Membrane protein n=1 Tax=Tunturiibacter gelidiferens TaxID=3069689 RepID=A0A9X0QB34_9BACT|nr:DUF2306 domain-containing protein [Edaphobacter lichenicola]MBB5327271.1 putative membrane protein [Edaphobacter lichenicola]